MTQKNNDEMTHDVNNEIQEVVIFGLDLTHYSATLQLIILSVGLFLFFGVNSYLEEYIFKVIPDFHFGWYLTVNELFFFALLAASHRQIVGEQPFSRTLPIYYFLIVAGSMTIARGLTNVSLQYLNYPTQVLFKSLKLIPVMIASFFILSSRYNFWEILAAVLFSSSAGFFAVGDKEESPDFPLLGIIVVLSSLIFDALQNTTQDYLLQKNKSLLEVVLYTNFLAGVITLFYTLITGEFGEAYIFCSQDIYHTYFLFFIRSVVLYGGVICFTTLMKRFGAVIATIITTARKIVSILLSFIFFPKPYNSWYTWGVLLFLGAIAGQMYGKEKKRNTPTHSDKSNYTYTPLTSINVNGNDIKKENN